jgi:two-component system nitrate/nitrite response regulator NarL
MQRRGCSTILVGPNGLVREGLARILAAPNFRVLGSVASIRDLDLNAVAKHQPVLLILEFSNDPGAAISQIALFKKQCPLARVAVLGDPDQLDLVAAFQAGTNACFPKDIDCHALIKALELVMLGETILPSRLLSRIPKSKHDGEGGSAGFDSEGPAQSSVEGSGLPRLSSRERAILHCIIEGASNKVIARKIEIAEATVKVHVKAILRKIRASNRTQAAIWAMNHASLIWPDNGHRAAERLEAASSLAPENAGANPSVVSRGLAPTA